MEQKNGGAWRVILIIAALIGVAAVVAFAFTRMQKELGALRYRVEQWARLRSTPLQVDLTEE